MISGRLSLICLLSQLAVLRFATRNNFMVSESQQLLAKNWRNYKLKYNLNFQPAEESYRLGVYRKNLEFIHLFNEEDHSYKLGENQFAHWTHEEYLLWLEDSNRLQFIPDKSIQIPEEVMKLGISDRDWVAEGKVTSIKNQGPCGSCYSFTTMATIESAVAIATGKLNDLSEQEIVDCSSAYGNKGCSGGMITRTFMYAMDNGVLPLSAYPYVAKQGVCQRPNITNAAPTKIKSFMSLTPNNETILATVVSNINPVSVAIDAGLQTFKFYKSGIYNDQACSTTAVNHGVAVVGIGSSPSEFYLIKNSWGTTWGSLGYVQLARNNNNQCGVSLISAYPIV